MVPFAGVEGCPPLAIQQAPAAAGGPSSSLPQHPTAWPDKVLASHGLPGHGRRQSGHCQGQPGAGADQPPPCKVGSMSGVWQLLLQARVDSIEFFTGSCGIAYLITMSDFLI